MSVGDGILQSIFECSEVAVVVTDTTGTIRYVNAAVERLTKYGANDMVGKGIARFGGMSDAQQGELLQRLGAGRSWQGECHATRKSGEQLRISASINPFTHPTTNETLFIGFNREINSPDGSVAMLTSRERDVLELLAQGLHNKDIAKTLAIGHRTVGHHVSHILRKLGAPNRIVAATRVAQPLDKRD
ncbi:MAG: helix-turn-helix transcriptional regulator [Acidimicrobiales bacterium]